MESEKYAICFLCNDNYFEYIYVAIKSFIMFNEWFSGDIIILCDDNEFIFSEENLDKLKQLYGNIYKRIVKTKDYDELIDVYIDSMKSKRWKYTFYKFDIFRMNKYDKILLLDCDMIIIGSLFDLFTGPINGVSMVNENGMFRVEDYYNSGMMIIDKTLINDETFNNIINTGVSAKLNTKNKHLFSKEEEFGCYPEQDILNFVFYGKINDADIKYNTANYMLCKRYGNIKKFAKTKIVHLVNKFCDKEQDLTWILYRFVQNHDKPDIIKCLAEFDYGKRKPNIVKGKISSRKDKFNIRKK